MKTELFLLSFVFLITLTHESSCKEIDYSVKVGHKQSFNYVVETDLPANIFSDIFCQRLINKHKWHKIDSHISEDNIFRSLFNYTDESKHLWMCEVKIRKVEPNKMSIEINVDDLES